MSEPIQWAALSPEQRDRLVAEKLFGWKPVQCNDSIGDVTCSEYGDSICHTCKAYAFRGQALTHGIIPPEDNYTTSMDAIKYLRQRITEAKALHLHITIYTYNRCYATFSLEPPPVDKKAWSEANGMHCMEEAICLAALKAVGCEISR